MLVNLEAPPLKSSDFFPALQRLFYDALATTFAPPPHGAHMLRNISVSVACLSAIHIYVYVLMYSIL